MPATTSRSIVPAGFDGTDFAHIEPLMKELLARTVASKPELEAWLLDRSEIAAACSEARANLYITMTCETENTQIAQAYERYITQVDPRLKPYSFELEKRFVELSQRFELPADRYTVLARASRAEVELYREQNIPLETELAQLGQRFETVAGAMTVQFEGQERTLPQMAKYQELPDRAVRESAWRAVADRRLREAETFSDIYDKMIGLRHKVARNAGFDDYVGYAYKSKHRFDYGVKECENFHAGVEKAIVPLVRDLERKRMAQLKIDSLRPWDLSVDPKGRGPLKPFAGGRELMGKSVAAMQRLDPRLAGLLRELGDGSETRGARDGACLDLDSRKGKAPGGYQYMRDASRQPFIFMNAAGLHKDVETMVHEAGHAFHSMLCRDEPLVDYRHSPIEFAEVASMSMELLSMRHWNAPGSFYDGKPEDYGRACREQLKRSVLLLPWIATIDAFQHFVYGFPTHSRQQRTSYWLGLEQRFGGLANWDGIEQHRGQIWQRQLHLFSHPFYYIEYGIAQLGALQLWLISLEKGETTAIDYYIKGLSLGGSRPLPELFRASGLQFDFSPSIIQRLADRVQREMEKLPE
jgi:oligoendopeptidase F